MSDDDDISVGQSLYEQWEEARGYKGTRENLERNGWLALSPRARTAWQVIAIRMYEQDAEIERLRAVVRALVDTYDETPIHADLHMVKGAIRIDGAALEAVRRALEDGDE